MKSELVEKYSTACPEQTSLQWTTRWTTTRNPVLHKEMKHSECWAVLGNESRCFPGEAGGSITSGSWGSSVRATLPRSYSIYAAGRCLAITTGQADQSIMPQRLYGTLTHQPRWDQTRGHFLSESSHLRPTATTLSRYCDRTVKMALTPR